MWRMPMIRRLSLLFVIGLLCLTPACKQQEVPDTRAADERAIRDIETEWNKAVAAKNVAQSISCYSDDASILVPNQPIGNGIDAIRAFYTQYLAAPGLSHAIQTAKVDVARGGDLAYSQGTYAMSMDGPKGKPITDKGKYVAVYRKGSDGIWKVVADIANSDLPVVPPAK